MKVQRSKRRNCSKIEISSKTVSERQSGKHFVINPDGTFREAHFTDSTWWVNYVVLPEEMLTLRHKRKFRDRFRMPFSDWKKFVDKLNANEKFKKWRRGNTDCTGKPCSSIELLTLGALKLLGRADTFDNLEEVTYISSKVHRKFFEAFIEFGSEELYDGYVVVPTTKEEAALHTKEFEKAGFAGAVGSTDATHVIIKKCRYQVRQAHLGHKMNKTARTFNVTVNHRRRILSSTKGHPCTWNDKTLIGFDDFVSGLNDGTELADIEFELFEKCEDGRIKKRKYKGCWVLTDNGYLPWAVTMPPSKYSTSLAEMRWSQWLESIRKDIECTFGILKKRFTVLDKGIDTGTLAKADNIFLTCCALHNMILEIDERDEAWEDGIGMNDEGSNFALSRLNQSDDSTTSEEDEVIPEYVSDSFTIVRNMNQSIFKKKLIEHFDILFHQNKII